MPAPPAVLAEMERLREECRRFERKGMTQTAHHEMLARLEREFGKTPEAQSGAEAGEE